MFLKIFLMDDNDLVSKANSLFKEAANKQNIKLNDKASGYDMHRNKAHLRLEAELNPALSVQDRKNIITTFSEIAKKLEVNADVEINDY